ncbi:MAG: FtsX-like permease family protein [Oscillospiraceae bacterium]|nr:FtsX-like permease family protein [Oscillospiraceae bacterium]
MKRTQLIDALRNIRKERVSWISILVIAALAVMAYLGINFGADAIAHNGDLYYEKANFRDVEIISTKLITEDDLSAVRSAAGITDVEGIYFTSGRAVCGEVSENVDVISLSERINVPIIVEGRLPENENECAVEQDVAAAMGIGTGAAVSVRNDSGEPAIFLKTGEFTVVGIVWHADNPIMQSVVTGNRYVIVRDSAFDTEALGGAYMRAFAKAQSTEGLKYVTDEYIAAASSASEAIRAIADVRERLRTAEIRGAYSDEITAAEGRIADAEKTLADGRAELDDGWREYRDGEKKLADAKVEIEDNEKKLAEAEEELESGRQELDSARAQLADAKRQLDAAKREIDAGEKEYEDGADKLEEAKRQLEDGKAQLDEGRAELDEAKSQLEEAESELESGKAELDEARAEIEKNEKLLEDGKRELDNGEAELDAAFRELEAGREELEEGWKQIEELKENAREIIKDALITVIEAASADPSRRDELLNVVADIKWAEPEIRVNVLRSDLRAMDFKVTDSVTIDLAAVYDAVKNAEDLIPVIRNALEAVKDNLPLSDEEESAVNDAITNLYIAEFAAEPVGQIYDNLEAWDAGHEKYLSGVSAYTAGLWDYRNAKALYEDGVRALEEGKKAYGEALEKYGQGLADYEAGKEQYEEGEASYAENNEKYEEALSEYEAGEKALAEAREELDRGIAEYEEGLRKYNASLRAYRDGERDYADGLEKYDEGALRLSEGKADYADGTAELAEALEKLESGERDYLDGEKELEEGMEKLAAAKREYSELDDCRWVVLDCEGNAGYLGIKDSADNMKALGITFALLFIFVAALVIYSTVGKIVEEQRKLVGATKALGLFNCEIFAKYLFFGITATLIGTVIGIILGYTLIQYIILRAYSTFYVYGTGVLSFLPGLTAAVTAAGCALTAVAVWAASSNLLKSTATKLMQEKTPEIKHKSSNKKSRLPLYTRLIILNMRTDLKRISVTVVSIAGVCALLLTGFTMRMAVGGAITNQFKEISLYDAAATFNADMLPEVEEEIESEIERAGAECLELYYAPASFSVDGKLCAAKLIAGDLEKVRDYFAFGGAPDEYGLIINVRTSEKRNLAVGDTVTMYDDGMKPFEAKVVKTYDNYIGTEMLMSEESYKAVFGEYAKKNAYFIKGENVAQLGEKLKNIAGFVSFTDVGAVRDGYERMASVLNVVAVLLTVVAGAMAYFILLNLINMYISQKKRELTIMRVNGFTVREVKNYVARESIATTILGIAIGSVGGVMFAQRVVLLIETATSRFLREIQWPAVIAAIVITAGFIAAINAFALRKIRDLRLTDVQ